MSHAVRMLIGCVLPIILIFLLPLFGVSESATVFVFIILMFGCHLMMMGGHGHGGHAHREKESDPRNASTKPDRE